MDGQAYRNANWRIPLRQSTWPYSPLRVQLQSEMRRIVAPVDTTRTFGFLNRQWIHDGAGRFITWYKASMPATARWDRMHLA